jgi:hypothetical protein
MNLMRLNELGSLAKYLRVMYISWPQFAKIAINDEPVTNLENPFNGVPMDTFTNHQNSEFALKTTKVALSGNFTGIFVYKINRLVRVCNVMSIV